MFIETIGELNSLKKNTFPKSFWDTERVVSGLLSKLFWRGFQNCILSVQMTTLRKNKFLEERFFISFSDIQRKYFVFVKSFSAGSSKLRSTCPAEHFEENFVRKKIQLLFPNIEPKNFRPSGQSFSTGWWKLKVYGNIETFFEKSNFFIILGHWAQKFSAGLSILHSTHPWHLEKSFLMKKVNFLIFFGDWAKKFRASGTIFLAGLSKLHYTWHRNIMRKKQNSRELFLISFSDIQRKYFGFLSEKFRQSCQYCILRIHDNILKDFCWGKLISFYLFRKLSAKFWGFWHNFFGRVVKTALYVSVGTIWKKKNLVWKKKIIYIIFGY